MLGGLPAVTGSTSAGSLRQVCSGRLNLSGLTWEDSTVTWELRVPGGVSDEMKQGARDAISEWEHFISAHSDTGVTNFTEAGGSADVTVQLKSGGGRIAGQELTRDRDNDGKADKSRVHVSGSAFGDFSNAYTRTFVVTLHELGHSFQLGHSNNENDVMYDTYRPGNDQLSTCDQLGFNTAHEGLIPPRERDVNAVSCSDSC